MGHVDEMRQSILDCIDQCLTPWHVEKYLSETAQRNNIKVSSIDEMPSLEAGKKYLIHRNGMAVAVTMPAEGVSLERVIIIASHTDSPCLKIKQKGFYQSEGASLINTEVYGAPILASWLGRKLSIAGKVWGKDSKGSDREWLLPLNDNSISCVIPNVAIHLDRSVNDQGLQVAKQEGLSPVISLSKSLSSFDEFIKSSGVDITKSHFFDLSIIPEEKAKCSLVDDEALLAPRLDNLTSVWAAFHAFLTSNPRSDGVGLMYLFCNHEEIGSETSEGAYSRIVEDIFDEIISKDHVKGAEKARLRSRSIILSCDAAHGFHYTALEKYDSRHRVRLGNGVALKINSQQRYSSPPALLSTIISQFEKASLAYQVFTARNDIPSGTTIGPILSARLGIDAIDLGVGVIGMHAAIEMASIQDILDLERILSFYSKNG